MKTTIAAVLITLLLPINLFAQKYSTHTGQVSFTTMSVLGTITGTNNAVDGMVNARSGIIEFKVPVKEMTLKCPHCLSFNYELADRFQGHYMQTDQYPTANYNGKIINLKAINFSKDTSCTIQTEGQLIIHGVSRNVTISGTLSIKGSQLTIVGQFKVKTAAYNIRIPESIKNMYLKEAIVTVNCVLQKELLAQE